MSGLDNVRPIYLDSAFTDIKNNGLRAVLITGKAKVFSLEGNILAAKMLLDEAAEFAEKQNARRDYLVPDEVLAYVYYETATFFFKVNEYSIAGRHLHSARRLVESQNLARLIEYQLDIIKMLIENKADYKMHESYLNSFRQSGLEIMHIIALRQLSILYRQNRHFDKAEKRLYEALTEAIDGDYPLLIEQVKNSLGYLQYEQGNYSAAREMFQHLLPFTESKFQKSIVLENIALTYSDEQDYERSAQFCDQALVNSQKYSVISQIPDECLFLGDLYQEKLSDLQMAEHYYHLGYQAALELGGKGFPLTGDRLKVVEKYHKILTVEKSRPTLIGQQETPFRFAVGMTWKEIQDIFHYNLILFHTLQNREMSALPTGLEMKPTTFYSLRSRLVEKGFSFPEKDDARPFYLRNKHYHELLQKYIRNLYSTTWNSANEHFEKDVIEFLFKQVGYQKTRLASVLHISYPTVLAKTRDLTMVPDEDKASRLHDERLITSKV